MPKPLCKQSKELIVSLIAYFEAERENNGPLLPLTSVRERVSSALNIHIATIHKISSMIKHGITPSNPKRKRIRDKPVRKIDDFTQCAIRNTIYDMYKNKQHITLSTLNSALKEKDVFSGCNTSLWKILRDIGFRYKKDDPKRGLMEISHIAIKRITFMQQYIRLKNENVRQFVFLDETWIFQDGTTGKSWQDATRKTVKASKVGGRRSIVLHAGNSDGFIPGAELVFSSRCKSLDYHGDMNRENFLKWFETQLLINLENPSVIVMDNASYHSTIRNKPPTASSTKLEIQRWLTNNNIDYDSTALKIQLLHLVEQHKPQPVYEADELAELYGHMVLRLPPYHCIFNPIELIWGITKRYYANHVGKYGRSEEGCTKLWKEALNQITAGVWCNSIQHTEKEIQKWWNREVGFDREETLELIITANTLSDTDSDTDFD